MIVQGLRHDIPYTIKSKTPGRGKPEEASKSVSTDMIPLQHIDSKRLDLIQKIQKKIKSGFYNSDAVLEDLSHGFAKVIDQSL